MSIVIEQVQKTFVTDDRVVDAVSPTDLVCANGSFTGILGPSGCGKTTLLRMIADLETPTAGSIRIMDRTPYEARVNRLIGMVFQRPALLPWRTVSQNIALPAEVARVDNVRGESISQRVQTLVELVGLQGFEHAYPGELSGGMQSRVGIARGLMLEPGVLLMDEPFAALDQINREKMQLELARICESAGVTAVLVTHSIPEAVFLADRVIVMSTRPGRIIADETVPFNRPRTLEIMETPEFAHITQQLRSLLL